MTRDDGPAERESPTLADYWMLARASGVRRAWRYFVDNHLFDLLHGSDTAHWKPKNLYDADLPNLRHGFRYEASHTSRLRRSLAAASRLAPPSDFTFFDLGCGKGKALLMAARSGFGRVVGLEYDPHLAGIARRNVAGAGAAAQILCGDAREFGGYADKSVVYLFNPFDDAVLRDVVERLEQLPEAVVIYGNPVYEACFSGWEKVAEFGGPQPIGRDVIYRLRRAGPTSDEAG